MVYNYIWIDWRSSRAVNNGKNHFVILYGDEFIRELERSGITTLYTYHFQREDPITGYTSEFSRSQMFLFENECTVFFCDLYSFSKIEDFKDALEKNFIPKFHEIKELTEYDRSDYTPEEFYREATEVGYRDAKTFMESLKFYSGSVESINDFKEDLEKSKAGRFRTKLDMVYAHNRGFKTQEDFDDAKNLGILNERDYESYRILQSVKYKMDFDTMDKAHLYVLLNQQNDQLKDVRKIFEEMKFFGFPKGNPEWYTTGLNSIEDVISFLTNNRHCVRLGKYRVSDGTFENLLAKTIYVDGNNVACRGGTKRNSPNGKVKFILMVIEELRKIFQTVKVFCDADIWYIIDDKARIRELEKSGIITIVPSNSIADEWLEIWSRDNDNYIVTNDNYKEMQEEHPELKQRLIKYLATDEGVRISEKNLRTIKYRVGERYEKFDGFVRYGTWADSYTKRELDIPLSLRRIY